MLVFPNCNIVAYSLMPNHFHFLLDITEQSTAMIQLGGIKIDKITNGFRLALSEYAQDFNKKYKRSGSLFRQKTKSKCLTDNNSHNYPFICFHYIHQNPLKANLVQRMEDWEYSSFRDYVKVRNGTLCKQFFAYDLIGVSKENFYEESYKVIDEELLNYIFEQA
ncbi:MAG: transposase [Cytophagales bacterium]|nr:MAG: transposase [Cytophagales bacterium]